MKFFRRTTELFDLPPRVLAVHGNGVHGFKEPAIQTRSLSPWQRAKVVTVEAHDHRRIPECFGKAEAVAHRTEVRVRHVVFFGFPAERGQPVEAGQALRLIPIFPPAQHLQSQPRRMRQAPEEFR